MAFVVVAVLIMIVFGAVLEGAPALIIFGPLLAPIAMQAGRAPAALRHGDGHRDGARPVRAAGRAGALRDVRDHGHSVAERVAADVKVPARAVVGLIVLVFVPALSLWLPAHLGLL